MQTNLKNPEAYAASHAYSDTLAATDAAYTAMLKNPTPENDAAYQAANVATRKAWSEWLAADGRKPSR